jgi:hypothetical protein
MDDDWKAKILLWKLKHDLNEKEKQGNLFPPDEKKKLEQADRLAELQRNARNKVPPKPRLVDEDGNEIPF